MSQKGVTMQNLPYLRKNRFGVYVLRFSLPLHHTINVEKSAKHALLVRFKSSQDQLSYRQVVTSLGVKDAKAAKRVYFILISEATRLFHEVCRELKMTTQQHTKHEKVAEFKSELEHLVNAISRNPDNARIIAQTHTWRLKNLYREHVDSAEERHQMDKRALRNVSSPKSTVPNPRPNYSKLRDELDKYLAAKRPDWKRRSFPQNKSNLIRFLEIVGTDKDCNNLTGADVERYLAVMCGLPRMAHHDRQKVKDDRSDKLVSFWADLAENNKKQKLSLTGIEKHAIVVGGFLKWLFKRGNVDRDLSVFMAISKKARDASAKKRVPYSLEDLETIFSSYIYSDELRNRESPKTFHFWTPLIAMHSGLRVGEIAVLECSDIKAEDGIYYFDINEQWKDEQLKRNDLDKSKKNKSSVRRVPVHNSLIEMGLLDLLSPRKSGLLFPDLRLDEVKGIGNLISRWFNEYFVRYANVRKQTETGEHMAFHSFRHLFTTTLDSTVIEGKTLDRDMRQYLTGHSDGAVRTKVYSHGFNLEHLSKYVNAMDFGVDLTGVSFERFLKRASK